MKDATTLISYINEKIVLIIKKNINVGKYLIFFMNNNWVYMSHEVFYFNLYKNRNR